MSKKPKQSKKATKNSKRAKVAAQPDEETNTASLTVPADIPQATPSTQEVEVAVDSQMAEPAPAPDAPVAGSEAAPKATRRETAKANIKVGLRPHQIAGRPTKEQLILIFGKSGYLLTWPKRTEKFGITPETFQSALAKGVAAVPLTPVAKPTAEKTKRTP
jgi:hypothetical protein